MFSVVLGDPLRAKNTGLGERKIQTACDNGPRLDSKHTHHIVQYVPYPAGTNTFFQQPLKNMYFSSGCTCTLYWSLLLCVTHQIHALSARKTSLLLYFLSWSCSFKRKTNVNMDKLVKGKEWGHCLHSIPVKTAQDTTFPVFGSDKHDYGCLCVNVNINSNNNSQQ